MKYNIRIDELRKYPQYIAVVTEWLYKEWGNHNKRYWESWVQYSQQASDIPKTYILFLNDSVVGTYSLWRCDLQSRQDLFPWFGGLYVDIKYRGQFYNGKKLGEILQRHAVSELEKLHYQEVYLFTSHATDYYNRNGWDNLCQAPDENDQMVNICCKTIR